MKNLHLLQLVPKFLRPPWLLRRTAAPKSDPPQETNRGRKEVRFVPMWTGGQILPFMVETESNRRRRDPYD